MNIWIVKTLITLLVQTNRQKLGCKVIMKDNVIIITFIEVLIGCALIAVAV